MLRKVFLAISSVLILGCKQSQNNSFTLPFYNDPSFTPIFLNDSAVISKKIIHTINDFSFLNQDSVFINQKKVEGKIHIANFMFTTCGGICPVMTRNLKIVNDSLSTEKNLVLLSYSVTPWIDSPSVLKKYKADYQINNVNWHFLTGTKKDIYQLARKSYFAEEDIGFSKDSTEFLHTEHFILVDKTKRIRGIYNGTLVLEMQQLIDDYKVLKSEN